jgi:transcriptional regulator with XRE-family HTH domain
MKSSQDASKLRQARKDAELSQWQLARSLGRSQGWLSNLECGYTDLTEDVAQKIAAAIEKFKGGRA